jgi:hypothetical protein
MNPIVARCRFLRIAVSQVSGIELMRMPSVEKICMALSVTDSDVVQPCHTFLVAGTVRTGTKPAAERTILVIAHAFLLSFGRRVDLWSEDEEQDDRDCQDKRECA